ncbi:hypothetical protein LI167_20520 [Phocaeicola dorei]|uniref:Uncharacterized protein n=1 Tax=Phocaeicola dorei TaxID=357276 RepID=A0AA95KSV3_9BACT|nr:hypothetical protein [Phocaeicola dorei]MCB6665714.1 hypothetical protein [Phocaeicola dorei]WHX09081.1 hypothetical protein QNN11_17025 [Phocaeicola dorei]
MDVRQWFVRPHFPNAVRKFLQGCVIERLAVIIRTWVYGCDIKVYFSRCRCKRCLGHGLPHRFGSCGYVLRLK